MPPKRAFHAGPEVRVKEILNGAIDEFRQGDASVASSKTAGSKMERPGATVRLGVQMGAGTANMTSDDTMREALSGMMSEIKRPEFSDAFAGITHGASFPSAQGSETDTSALYKALAVESGAEGAQGIAKTMEILQKLAGEADNLGAGGLPGPGMSSDAANAAEGVSDELINKMMKEFEGMGRKDDFASVVDGMMRQLLSKDIMLVPMKAICDAFPEWLAVHGPELDRTQYESYGRMYQTFQKMVDTYETQPDNFPRLLELMQDMQECGNPPAEIIAKLAPGLQMGSDGLPMMMPNMGPGMGAGGAMPGLPQAAGCTIM